MNSKDKERLLDRLIDLMALHKPWDSEGRGIPYVDAEAETFGVTCGQKNGGLYAAYFLIDQLKAGGLFPDPQQPRTDLDTAVYELTAAKPFAPFAGVKLFRNEDNEIEVSVSAAGRPADAIIAAIDKGMEDARQEIRRAMRSEIKSKEERREDRRRDRMGEVFSPAADEALVKAYLTLRVEAEFPGSNVDVTLTPPRPELKELLNDSRPRMEVTFDHPAGENYTRFNEFHPSLGKVFNGFCAVMAHGSDDRDSIQIAGTPARLAADILDHDPAGAKKAVQKIAPAFPALKKAMEAAVGSRAAAQQAATSAQKGIAADINVPAPLKIRPRQ